MRPEGWTPTTIGALATVGRGASPRPIQDPKWFAGTGPGWVRISDVTKSSRILTTTEQCLSPEGAARSVHLSPGDLVLSIAATIGKPIVLGINACIHDGFVYFKGLASNRVSTVFLYYFFQDRQAVLAGQGQAGTQKNINTSIVSSLPIALPPLSEQRKIATILTSIDDAIEATQAVIHQLQVVKNAMMAELLTRGLPGRHTKLKMTEIGEVPEEWEVVTLGQLTKHSAFGPRFPATDYSASGNVATIRTTDVTDDWEIDYTTVPRASLDPGSVRAHLLEDGDLLVTRSGTCGVVSVFRTQPVDVIPAAFLIRFRLHPNVNPDFVRLAMMETRTQLRVQAMAAGGVQKNLSGTNLLMLALPLPPLAEQSDMVVAVTRIDERIRSERACLRQMNVAKSALMSVLLTGEVRVTPDEDCA
jgi:type I restriction enzyme S subunit